MSEPHAAPTSVEKRPPRFEGLSADTADWWPADEGPALTAAARIPAANFRDPGTAG